MLLLLAALAAGVREPKPRPLNEGPWFATSDYPAEALKGHLEGKVGFALDVAVDGTVTACHIVSSSGHTVLDDATCALLRGRAHFKPALNPDGVPVPSNYTNSVDWMLPTPDPGASWSSRTDYPAQALLEHWEGKVWFTLDVGADGHVTRCTVRASSGHKVLDDQTCYLMQSRAIFTPGHDAAGKTIPSTYTSSVTWKIPD